MAGSNPIEAANRASEGFEGNPSNAVLSVLDEGGVANVVVELMSVHVDGELVALGYAPLLGTPSEGTFGPASLFVDSVQPTMFIGIGPIEALPTISVIEGHPNELTRPHR